MRHHPVDACGEVFIERTIVDAELTCAGHQPDTGDRRLAPSGGEGRPGGRHYVSFFFAVVFAAVRFFAVVDFLAVGFFVAVGFLAEVVAVGSEPQPTELNECKGLNPL